MVAVSGCAEQRRSRVSECQELTIGLLSAASGFATSSLSATRTLSRLKTHRSDIQVSRASDILLYHTQCSANVHGTGTPEVFNPHRGWMVGLEHFYFILEQFVCGCFIRAFLMYTNSFDKDTYETSTGFPSSSGRSTIG